MYYQTATALATIPKDRTKLRPYRTAEDVAQRIEALLEEVEHPQRGEGDSAPRAATPARAAFSEHIHFESNQQVLRVEVAVDIDVLDGTDWVARDELLAKAKYDARVAAIEFLLPLVRQKAEEN